MYTKGLPLFYSEFRHRKHHQGFVPLSWTRHSAREKREREKSIDEDLFRSWRTLYSYYYNCNGVTQCHSLSTLPHTLSQDIWYFTRFMYVMFTLVICRCSIFLSFCVTTPTNLYISNIMSTRFLLKNFLPQRAVYWLKYNECSEVRGNHYFYVLFCL